MSQSPLHAVYGAPATTHGVGSERQRLLAEVVGESPDPPREPLSRGARVASALVAFAVVGCAVIGMLSLVGGAPLARLGAIGDTGWARELTPEGRAQGRAERDRDATVVAVGNLAGLGETNMPAMGMVKHDLDEVAVNSTPGECPRRSSVRESETSLDWDVSYLASLFLADQIYVICFDCANLRIPKQIAHKTLLVDGKIYDACDQADSIGLDHYKRASLSHGAAISDAMIKRFGKVAVVEDDSTPPVGAHAVRLAPTDLHGFAQAMARGWASFAWVAVFTSRWTRRWCPGVQGDARTSRLCFVSSGGVRPATRTLSRRYYRWTVDKLISGGTIDYDVLPRAPGVLLTIPVLSAQKRLDINIEHQAAVSDLFAKRCLVGEVPEEFSRDEAFAEEELFEIDERDTESWGPHSRADGTQTSAERAAAWKEAHPESTAGVRRNVTERTAAVEAVVDNLMTTSDGGSEETELTEAEPSSAAESSDAELEDDAELGTEPESDWISRVISADGASESVTQTSGAFIAQAERR